MMLYYLEEIEELFPFLQNRNLKFRELVISLDTTTDLCQLTFTTLYFPKSCMMMGGNVGEKRR